MPKPAFGASGNLQVLGPALSSVWSYFSPHHTKAYKAAASWAIVQQKHAQLQCNDTVYLNFRLFQSILPLLFTMVALFEAGIVPQIPLPTTFANS